MAEDNKSVQRPYKGLSTDKSYIDQPKGSTSFVINGVDESRDGDQGFIVNEEGNELVSSFKTGFVPLGQEYIGDGKYAVLMVALDESISEIGILDENDVYSSVVTHDLGFKMSKPIDIEYRLRRGCEKVIYWADPKLRSFNFNKQEDYKDANGDWDTNAFKLYKTASSIPVFNTVVVEETGTLAPGSYNAAIQFLDNDLNPTEWLAVSDTVKIFEDSLDKDYFQIRGTTGKKTPYQNFGDTNKSITFNLENLDPSYPYYRMAFIEATSGTGKINAVKVSAEIPTSIRSYTYSGEAVSEIPVEEIYQFANIIEEADHVKQLENILVIAGSRGKQINYCELQKYASRISTDITIKKVQLNTLGPDNSKNPILALQDTGYMPGEIYSFGITWVLDDMSLTPNYHIPGKTGAFTNTLTQDSFPIGSDNELDNTYYNDRSSCLDFWGYSATGTQLKNQKVRHHRIPTRAELGLPLLEYDEGATSVSEFTKIKLNIAGTVSNAYLEDTIRFTVKYTVGTNRRSFSTVLHRDQFENNGYVRSVFSPEVLGIDDSYSDVKFYENGVLLSATGTPTTGMGTSGSTTGLVLSITVSKRLVYNEKKITSDIIGVRFSGIEPPDEALLGGHKIVGYYITRQLRDENNKTVLDTGVLVPVMKDGDYLSHSHIFPRDRAIDVRKDVYGLIHPEQSFNKKKLTSTTKIVKQGYFERTTSTVSNMVVQDVMAGSTFDPDIHKRRVQDSDGFDLHVMSRDNGVNYVDAAAAELVSGTGIRDLFYLDSLDNKLIKDTDNVESEVYNLSADNRIGILTTSAKLTNSVGNLQLPYVILSRDLANPYQNFNVEPYYKETSNPIMFEKNTFGTVTVGDSIDLFNGDSYITPMRYHTSSYYETAVATRATKKGLLNYMVGVLAIAGGLLLAPFTAGASLALTSLAISAIGLGVASIATGIKKDTIARVWNKTYDEGLQQTIQDASTVATLGYVNPDDEIQWFTDTVTNLWFESSVNMSLRMGATLNITDFLDPADSITPTGGIETAITPEPRIDVDAYTLAKLTQLDPDHNDGRLYRGFANAEIYEINPDYQRTVKEKIYSNIGLEYDCCSDCIEQFPQRYHYSEQSFQEELTDNYRVFLPNNYRDMEGNTGKITNLYRFYDNLFIHTEEALWKQPQNFQERVTDEIVSFIGTGEYFSMPPQKILDDKESSAGTKYKQGCLKTRNGILFPCEAERTWYLFDGQKLDPISSLENERWFTENMPMVCDQDYFSRNSVHYPFLDCPTHPIGVGYVSAYDIKNKRFIVTKKDLKLHPAFLEFSDYRIIYQGGVRMFLSYSTILSDQAALGYELVGVVGSQLKFKKTSVALVNQTRYDLNGNPLALPVAINKVVVSIDYVNSIEAIGIDSKDLSWTMSFSLKKKQWVSYHSYTPSFYLSKADNFYGWMNSSIGLWKFNKKGLYQTYFGQYYAHMVEMVSVSSPLTTKIYDTIMLQTRAEKYDVVSETYLELYDITFNKFYAYNSRQITGVKELVVKDTELLPAFYIDQQITNKDGKIIIDRTEKNWMLNDLRNYRASLLEPMFEKSMLARDTNLSFIDKLINTSNIDENKSWTELESLRDKFLVIRFIMDRFDDTRLITNYSIETETPSIR